MLGLILAMVALPLAAAAAECPPPPAAAVNPTVRLEVSEPKLIHHHDVDLLGLPKINHSFETVAPGWVMLGLTRRNDEFSLAVRFLTAGRCLWVEEVSARLGGDATDVYVASNYPAGTCEYNAVLTHENTHVAINAAVLKAFAPRIGAGLRAAVHALFPVVSAGSEDGKKVTAMLSAAVNPIYQEMIGELRRRNQALDSPYNYQRTQQLCHNWFPPGTALPRGRN